MIVDDGFSIAFPALQDMGNHVGWRRLAAEAIAHQLDMERFGIREIYLIGSTETGMAGPGSDIDLLVYSDGDPGKIAQLELWLDGWSRALALLNYTRTGQKSDRLLDIHIVTDSSLRAKDSFAIMMKSTTESARLRTRS